MTTSEKHRRVYDSLEKNGWTLSKRWYPQPGSMSEGTVIEYYSHSTKPPVIVELHKDRTVFIYLVMGGEGY